MPQLFLTTTPGLEPALAKECRALGLAPSAEPGGVTVEGDYHRLNLELRTASRVLLRLGELAPRELSRIDVRKFWTGSGDVEVSASAHNARMRPTELESLARQAWKLPPPVRKQKEDEESDALRFQLRLEGDRCTVSVDTSGELLNRRGYRQEGSHAPLRETLAAGLLLLAGYDGSTPFWDPMCGSGTIAIEAGLMATRRAPGLERHFAFEKFPGFDAAAFAQLKESISGRAVKANVPLNGTDIHAGALGAARRNARRAGVELKLERVDVAKLPVAAGPAGFVVTNPPYGKRVGERGDLGELFRALGNTLRTSFKGWRYGVLVPEERLEKALALKPETVHRVQNGGLWLNYLVGKL
ncbi:MAG: class I SAM-dependent RNA methyltransferase [Myxococcaceae bacterium]